MGGKKTKKQQEAAEKQLPVCVPLQSQSPSPAPSWNCDKAQLTASFTYLLICLCDGCAGLCLSVDRASLWTGPLWTIHRTRNRDRMSASWFPLLSPPLNHTRTLTTTPTHAQPHPHTHNNTHLRPRTHHSGPGQVSQYLISSLGLS